MKRKIINKGNAEEINKGLEDIKNGRVRNIDDVAKDLKIILK